MSKLSTFLASSFVLSLFTCMSVFANSMQINVNNSTNQAAKIVSAGMSVPQNSYKVAPNGPDKVTINLDSNNQVRGSMSVQIDNEKGIPTQLLLKFSPETKAKTSPLVVQVTAVSSYGVSNPYNAQFSRNTWSTRDTQALELLIYKKTGP